MVMLPFKHGSLNVLMEFVCSGIRGAGLGSRKGDGQLRHKNKGERKNT